MIDEQQAFGPGSDSGAGVGVALGPTWYALAKSADEATFDLRDALSRLTQLQKKAVELCLPGGQPSSRRPFSRPLSAPDER